MQTGKYKFYNFSVLILKEEFILSISFICFVKNTNVIVVHLKNVSLFISANLTYKIRLGRKGKILILRVKVVRLAVLGV